MSRSAEFDAAYRMSHRPSVDGPGLHAAHEVYPDIHEHPEYYLTAHTPEERSVRRETMSALRSAKDKPDADVKVHRAVPTHVNEIHPGDWVTPSRSYAEQHAGGEGGMHVISTTAKAKHLIATGDHPPEFGYNP